MIRILFTLILLTLNFYGAVDNIDEKIENSKKILDSNNSKKNETELKIKDLADKIESQNSELEKLSKDINDIALDILEHQNLLEASKNKLEELKNESSKLISEKKTNEDEIINNIIDDFSTSLALQLVSKNTLKELIDTEVLTILSENSKYKILKLDNNYDLLTNNEKVNRQNMKKLTTYIKQRQKAKDKLSKLKDKQDKSLASLEKEHKSYQAELKKVVEQQEELKKLLSNLDIIKQEEEKKEQEAKEEAKREAKRAEEEQNRKEQEAKAKKEKEEKNSLAKNEKKRKLSDKEIKELFAEKPKKENTPIQTDFGTKEQEIQNEEDIQEDTTETRNQKYASKSLDLEDVKKVGSSTDGVKIVKYKGEKTIAPLKAFKVLKNFGTYYDPVYKIKLFNESIVLKSTEENAKVVSVLNGKVVYAKKNAGMLDNVVIIQHENGVHTVYSHLAEISPTLSVGKWVKKGYVVGRAGETLMFQATKDSSHIDPRDMFSL